MTTKVNVLVTGAGSIVGQGIAKCLRLANKRKDGPVTYRVVAADMSAQAAGLYRSDLGLLVPPASSQDYIDMIIRICTEQNIKAIFVGSDEELMPISGERKLIESKTGAFPITNPTTVLSTALDKWKTFEFLDKNNLPCAKSSLPENQEELIQEFGFPLVVKPRQGHGSLHIYVVNNKDEIKDAVAAIQQAGWLPVVQEYLEGEDTEFTSGVTVDKSGKYAMSSISIRRTLKGGQTYKAFIDDFKDIRKSAEETALKLGGIGPINVQSRLIKGESKIFEINPRFSATCPLRAIAGVNEPDIIFRNTVLGEDIKIENYQKFVCLRYWNELYVPYSNYQEMSNTKRIENSDAFIPDYF